MTPFNKVAANERIFARGNPEWKQVACTVDFQDSLIVD